MNMLPPDLPNTLSPTPDEVQLARESSQQIAQFLSAGNEPSVTVTVKVGRRKTEASIPA